jgi:hypothetical protein
MSGTLETNGCGIFRIVILRVGREQFWQFAHGQSPDSDFDALWINVCSGNVPPARAPSAFIEANG